MEGHVPGGFNGYHNQPFETFSQAGTLHLPSHDGHYHPDNQHIQAYDVSQNTTFQYPTSRMKPGHGSTSTQSSFASRSVFSDFSNRNSVASTATNVSRHSITPEEALTTCVSRRERAKPADKPAKPAHFWCTACGKGFGSKHDWKTHEEIFQERFEEYWCEFDEKTFFSKKDFTNHHYKTHSCRTCVKFNHAEKARRERKSRQAWGCGFCGRLELEWDRRCDHVAAHFKEGKTLDDWKQSRVISSLLQRPALYQALMSLMERNQIQVFNMGWNSHKTGRAEGFPDSGRPAQLQDLLEWYIEGENPYPLVELAIEKGLHQQESLPRNPPRALVAADGSTIALTAVSKRGSNPAISSQVTIRSSVPGGGTTGLQPHPTTRHSRQDKALPPDPPRNEVASHNDAAFGNEARGVASWDRFSDTIVPDGDLPDPVSMELDHAMHDIGKDDFNWSSWLAD
ncbi:hypothetical protein BDV96DRAFT_644227 [Lophiotrema nucula]|uniref:C2H2-type domain-containing protein n=1 Tax=Lophiotrema nucula TaxID=690887 RepID=A0A6A5ZEF9_9PLEO|nr:hypothetical protein BDV96DRAFT_644227 [Lophiotrema nucula]